MKKQDIESIEELLKTYLENDISAEEIVRNINFKILYEDPILKGELTTPYIEMLSEYQESVFYAYLAITGREENLVFLTDEEKAALSLKFKIDDGSDIIQTAFEKVDIFNNLLKEGVQKMNGTQVVLVALIIAGYLSVDKLADTFEKIETKKIEVTVPIANIEREKELYSTFKDMQKNLLNNKFDRKKQEALHKPLYAYPDNTLKTQEEVITSEQAKELKIKPLIETENLKGLYTVDGVKGASESRALTTFWLINKAGKDFSIQLKNNDLDTMRKNLLFENMGKTIYLDLEIKRKDGVIKNKTINAIYDKDSNPELFI
ncbi:hypothetical protein [Candidatus Sulfurimonas baltica]|uniref:Uncharacterized protein n=1 Tax=Candidatus Sulfurimonas baltica TaxID=2740404 RepID=A0A7S7RM92_9BACT|nr:hypothetical protein [Candidatus Sulfurimonas baltica]QOY51193.1 hypothetical protein HUE88_08620 [Candidatus Sulfurimonas baltica]